MTTKQKLSDVIQVNPRRQLKKGNIAPFVAMENIVPYEKQISEYTQRKISGSNSKFKNGDTLLAKITPSLENGKTVFVDFLKKNEIGHGSTEFFVLCGKENQILDQFVYYLMRTSEFREEAIRSMTGTSGRQRVQETVFDDYEIILPTISIQEKISKPLSDLDAKIQNLRNQNRILEQMAQAIFKSWFVDFDGVTEFEDSELGKIPKGWRIGKIKDVIKIFDGKRIPLSTMERENRKGNIPYYGATTIIDFIDNHIFDGKFLLLGEDGSVVHDDGTPFIQYVSGKFWVNNHAHVIQGKNSFNTEIIYLFFKNLNIHPWVTGAVQLKINQSNLLSIPIIIPNENFLKKINQITFPIFSNLLKNEKSISILTKTRDALLPKLMSGEIRV
mgnify:CR=1 FL=1